MNTYQRDCRSNGKCAFNFRRNFYTIFQSDFTILHCHQQCMRALVTLPPCQHLALSGFLFFFSSHSKKCVMTSHCGFKCWVCFHLWIWNLNILFGEISVQMISSFFNWIFVFLLALKFLFKLWVESFVPLVIWRYFTIVCLSFSSPSFIEKCILAIVKYNCSMFFSYGSSS